jgi:predicted ABC-type ATPase
MIYIVTGPPCVGKSTWVKERAKSGDLIVDLDRIALAITSEDTPHHEYPRHVRSAAIAMRTVAVNCAMNYGRSGTSYITAPLAVLMERAKNERPAWVAAMIPRWYDDPEQD